MLSWFFLQPQKDYIINTRRSIVGDSRIVFLLYTLLSDIE